MGKQFSARRKRRQPNAVASSPGLCLPEQLDFKQAVGAQLDEVGKIGNVGAHALPAEGRAEQAAIGAGLILNSSQNDRLMNPEGIT
jgi:hypothetical protein